MLVAPSLLTADFNHLGDAVEMINKSEADFIHLDIMDGVFVPNISFGFPVIQSVTKIATKPLDAHLMIVDPDRYIQRFADLGVKYLSVHYEACTHLNRSLSFIRNCGMKAGVALNPHTPPSALEYIIEYCDFVLVMSVNPGFGAQSFIDNSIKKISAIKEMILKRGLHCLIEVDGGVSLSNIGTLSKAGADIVVAGNSVFSSSDPIKTIHSLHI